MLAFYGISGVEVRRGGHGQDFFDPRSNTVTLSPEAYDGRSITATATACHEVGHACQYAEGLCPHEDPRRHRAGREPGLQRVDLPAHAGHHHEHRAA